MLNSGKGVCDICKCRDNVIDRAGILDRCDVKQRGIRNTMLLKFQSRKRPSMCCERWSNEAARVHADIMADPGDVPAKLRCDSSFSARACTQTFLLFDPSPWCSPAKV